VVVNCTTSVPHAGRAFERFTPEGPLAVIPLTRARVAIIWTLPVDAADARMALPELEFRDELQRSFGHRLGRFERIGARSLYRLRRTLSEAVTGPRTLLIGNAAMNLHPIAGQGFNLALRDIATIAELIADAKGIASKARSHEADIGAPELLDRYRAWRASDQLKVAAFTHGLVRSFGASLPGMGVLRGLGLIAFDLLPGAKSQLARHTMGTAGRLPKLARHLKLT
jgi:2-octaprenyl-6-methoxyphenol hydroxylase